jgi:hypothetical protein
MRVAGGASAVGLVLVASLSACSNDSNPLLSGDLLATTVASTSPAPTTAELGTTTTAEPVATTAEPAATTRPATTPPTTRPATTAPATSQPPLTFAEIGAALNGPAAAYIQSRGGAAETEALRVAAEQLVATGRTKGLPDISTPDGQASASVLLEFLSAQPEFVWVKALEQAGVLSGLPVFFLDGLYQVGKDVSPGSYEAFDVEYCFWQRMDSQGRQIDSFYTELAARATATISPFEFAFASNECGVWFRMA